MPLSLKSADVLVLPNSNREKLSRAYTSPMKLFEYMASGRPIVASDVPSLREILDETNCYFFTPDDPESLAQVVITTINNPEAQKKADKARKDVEKYSWDKRAVAIMEFMR